MPLRIRESVRNLRLQSGLQCGRQCPSRLVSPQPVIGKPCGSSAVVGIAKIWAFGEHPVKRRVQLSTLSWQQIAIQRLLGQCVPKGVRLGGGIGNQNLMCHGLA